MKDVFVIDAQRTPVGKYGGSLSTVRPDDMAAFVIRKIVERNPTLDVHQIEDVVFGAANQAGEDNRDVARMALLLAGLPIHIGGVTVNRLCASGLQAIMDASKGIMCGHGNIYLAGGVESMSRAPFVMAKSEEAFGRKPEIYDTTIGWRFTNKKLAELYHPFSMGETAENVARQWNISRVEQDEFAFASQEKYFKAQSLNRFNEEIAPYPVIGKKNTSKTFGIDEHPRKTSIEELEKLKPAFAIDGTVTAGNSSGINDGAACLLLADGESVQRHQFKPMARIVSFAIAGVEPKFMGIGPVPATNKALQRANLSVNDLDLIELNEAFASQALACIHDLKLNIEKVNVNGGSIAIGHPLGCSGARISTTLLHEMKKRGLRYGLATMCIGVGQGAAIIFENIQQ